VPLVSGRATIVAAFAAEYGIFPKDARRIYDAAKRDGATLAELRAAFVREANRLIGRS
jgi:hypothetical protein